LKSEKKLAIYDTTLRDGNQALGISLSLSDKLRIATRLSEAGFQYLEGGWPNPTNAVDTEFFKAATKLKLSSKLAVFGSTKRPHTTCGEDQFLTMLIKSGAPVATIFGKTWDLHVEKVLRFSLQQNLDIIGDTVSCLKKHMDEVFYDAEHFSTATSTIPDTRSKRSPRRRPRARTASSCATRTAACCPTNSSGSGARFRPRYRARWAFTRTTTPGAPTPTAFLR